MPDYNLHFDPKSTLKCTHDDPPAKFFRFCTVFPGRSSNMVMENPPSVDGLPAKLKCWHFSIFICDFSVPYHPATGHCTPLRTIAAKKRTFHAKFVGSKLGKGQNAMTWGP